MPMGRTLGVLGLALWLAGAPAHAQFQNKSVGLSAGYINPLSTGNGSVTWAIPFGITASYYLDNGFDLVFELDGIVAHTSAPVAPNIWGLSVTPIGVRYLFMLETFRPYVGADASYLHFFTDSSTVLGTSSSTNYIGVGPNVGFDVFVSESVSLGLKARYNVYLSLNSVDTSFDATARLSAYF